MKRSFLPVIAAAALLAACGSSGHKAAVSGHPIVRLLPPSPTWFRHSAASNRAFARRDAAKLMRIVVVPPRARQVAAVPKSAPAWFREELSHDLPGAAVVHRTWVVNRPLKEVVRFVRTHAKPRPRPEWPLNRETIRIGSRPGDSYLFPPVPGRSSSRWLNLRMLDLPGVGTVITAQAGDKWIKPPPRSAEIPRAVRRIDITSRYGSHPSVRLHVRDRYDVGALVSWMNGLGVSPHYVCLGGLVGGPIVTLTFRDATGAVLARGTIGGRFGGSCGSMALTVNGRKAPPLIAGDLLRRIEQHLDADLSPPLPRDVARCLRWRGWHVRTVGRQLVARQEGRPTTLTFRATGKVTRTGPMHTAIARCLRSSPGLVYYG